MAANSTNSAASASTSSKGTTNTTSGPHKLGLWGLVAIVFSSMIGGGIFNIAQNMAVGAGLGAVIISWIITGVGVLFLAYTFKVLADARPDLNAGIYQYAQVGWGNYVGFNIAWGYWACVAMGNVAYAVMLNDAFGAFWPIFLKHQWPTVVFGLGLIWAMFTLTIAGLQLASLVNTLMSILKTVCIICIIVILIIGFKVGMFTYDFWGTIGHLGNIGTQIESCMLVTLWCFIGIEGAAMMSASAKNPKDVGKASVMGFLLALLLYALVSILCFGVMKQAEMAKLDDPSVAYVLKSVCGPWAYWFVVCTVIISLFSSWVAWTMVCAQTPYQAAVVKIMPKQFAKLNKKNMPAYGLVWSSVIMSIFMVLVVTAKSVYLAALDLTTIMVLPAYLFSGMFLWKASYNPQKYLDMTKPHNIAKYRTIGIIATVYCGYTLYAGNLLLLIVTAIFYIAGTWFYVMARKQYDVNAAGKKVGEMFTTGEKWIFAFLCLCAIAGVILLILKKVSL